MSTHTSFRPFLLPIFSGFAGFSVAGTVTVDSVPPVVNGADIAQLDGNSDAGGDQGHLWSNRPHQGQSFVTGSDPSGYFLSAVTLKNLNNTIGNSPTFNVQIGTLTEAGSPETFTQIGSTETGVAPSYTPGDYLTFTFTVSAFTVSGFQ